MLLAATLGPVLPVQAIAAAVVIGGQSPELVAASPLHDASPDVGELAVAAELLLVLVASTVAGVTAIAARGGSSSGKRHAEAEGAASSLLIAGCREGLR